MTRSFGGIVGASLCGLWLFAATWSLIHTPYDPVAMALDARLEPPSERHWMGTDQYGRDLFSRVLDASAVSLLVSFVSVFAAMLLGAPMGAFAAYRGGKFDKLVLIGTEAVMAFPALLLVLLLLSVTGPSNIAVIIALSLASVPTVIRVSRAAVLSLKEQQFVEAAWVAGASRSFTLMRLLLPNCISPLSVLATSLFAAIILIESALSFLGLGVPPPQATWGALLADSRQYLAVAPWLSLYPGAVITLAVVGINLFGDALRDALDPRLASMAKELS
ncbi:MAG: ABC transporter permease [Pseudomonadota bacterium]